MFDFHGFDVCSKPTHSFVASIVFLVAMCSKRSPALALYVKQLVSLLFQDDSCVPHDPQGNGGCMSQGFTEGLVSEIRVSLGGKV